MSGAAQFADVLAIGAHRILARLAARDTGYARVAERLGMRREAHLVPNDRFEREWGR